MTLFQNLWTLLTTPNEGLIGIIFNDWGIPFIYVEATVSALLFTQILNIKYTKKQFIIYVLLISTLSGIFNVFIGKPYSAFINMALYIIVIIIIFKPTFLKAILAEFIPIIISSVLEIIFCKVYVVLFNSSYDEMYTVPLIRLFFVLLIYLLTYIMYRLAKHYKINIILFEDMSKKNKFMLIINFIFAVIAMGMQVYVIVFYLDELSIFTALMSSISLIAYFVISIFSLLKTTKLEQTSRSLEEAQLYNKTLQLLHDNLRTFKHNYANTMQSIQGYIANDDMRGLNNYFKGISKEYNSSNNLTALNPTLIDDPALYSLIASKYLLAEENNITFNINISIHFKELKLEPYILTEILGILLDNALDAAKLSNEKEIHFEVNPPFNNGAVKKYVISVKNTYSNKDIDIDRIREKGYTSKTFEEGSHGLGLWEVNKILKKSKNLNLHTTKNDKYFIQNLEIFDNLQ